MLSCVLASQIYVLASMLVINPPVVDSRVTFVDCERGTPAVAMLSLSREACSELDVAFELPADASKGEAPIRLRRFEQLTYYCALNSASILPPAGLGAVVTASDCIPYTVRPPVPRRAWHTLNGTHVHTHMAHIERCPKPVLADSNMFSGDAKITSLQLVCCVWVTVQCYFNDFVNGVPSFRTRSPVPSWAVVMGAKPHAHLLLARRPAPDCTAKRGAIASLPRLHPLDPSSQGREVTL